MYNIYSIVILILFDIPRFSVNDLHQIQVAAPSPSSRKSMLMRDGLHLSGKDVAMCANESQSVVAWRALNIVLVANTVSTRSAGELLRGASNRTRVH